MEASGEINGGRSSMVAEKEDDEQLHLKNMIASHPLYGLLIESHFNCLKVINFLFVDQKFDIFINFVYFSAD